jgi:hypothetical protein
MIVESLGLRFIPLASGKRLRVGDLEIDPIHPPYSNRDEWDVLPILVRDQGGDGSFMSTVDSPDSPATAERVARLVGRPSAWVYSHNYMDQFFVASADAQQDAARVTADLVKSYASLYEGQWLRRPDVAPTLILLVAGGFFLRDDLAPLNRHAFPGDPEEIAATLAARFRPQRFVAPAPGHLDRFSRKVWLGEGEGLPFLSAPPREGWPRRGADRGPPTVTHEFAAACGHTELNEAGRVALEAALDEFAGYLYGGPVHQALLAVDETAFLPRRAAFAYSVRTGRGDEKLVYVYEPQRCAFTRVECADARAEFVAGTECWGTDLLAALRIELVAGYMLIGQIRPWNHAPERIRCEIDSALSIYTHPLRHPRRYFELYRRSVEGLRPRVPAGRILPGPSSADLGA